MKVSEPVILLGHDVSTGRPVIIPLGLLVRHMWIQGFTGSRKTVLTASLLTQVLRFDPTAVVVIADLGGDQFLFNRIRQVASELKKPFQFTSVNREDDWDSLDPMAAITPLDDLSVAVSYLHSILGGDHGEGYGTGFFGRYSYVSILQILMGFVAEGVYSPTLHDFARRFAGTKGKLSEQSEAQLAAQMMLTYEQVQPSEWGHKRIDVPEALERGQVTYGFLPTLMHPGARMLATTLVFSFVLEAMRRHYAGLPARPIYLCIDEFPSVAGSKQWADLLVLARKYGIRIIILTQTSEQMKSRDRDLLPVVSDNTATKIWLTPTSREDIEWLQSQSKDVLKQRGASLGLKAGMSSVSMHEVYEPKLEANDIRDTAYTAGQGYLIANAFQGHSEPVRFRFTPDIPLDEYERLAHAPLPKRERPRMPRPGDRTDADFSARQAKLVEMLERKRRELRWVEA
jgi:hypothetical protein